MITLGEFVMIHNFKADVAVGRKDWALLVSADAELCEGKILEVYTLRWRIEVHFEETK